MKKIIVNKSVVRRLKIVRDGLEIRGNSGLCPEWKGPSSWLKNCHVCSEYFPKVKVQYDMTHSCPCYLYTPAYLIRRLNKIIQDSEDAGCTP